MRSARTAPSPTISGARMSGASTIRPTMAERKPRRSMTLALRDSRFRARMPSWDLPDTQVLLKPLIHSVLGGDLLRTMVFNSIEMELVEQQSICLSAELADMTERRFMMSPLRHTIGQMRLIRVIMPGLVTTTAGECLSFCISLEMHKTEKKSTPTTTFTRVQPMPSVRF